MAETIAALLRRKQVAFASQQADAIKDKYGIKLVSELGRYMPFQVSDETTELGLKTLGPHLKHPWLMIDFKYTFTLVDYQEQKSRHRVYPAHLAPQPMFCLRSRDIQYSDGHIQCDQAYPVAQWNLRVYQQLTCTTGESLEIPVVQKPVIMSSTKPQNKYPIIIPETPSATLFASGIYVFQVGHFPTRIANAPHPDEYVNAGPKVTFHDTFYPGVYRRVRMIQGNQLEYLCYCGSFPAL